jgi:prepilin-type N-terminal cleavage/methylation domain-containing protein
MKSKSTTCSRCSRRAGLTLIEVVAAIVILGTILVGVVLARSRHARQIHLAERKALAVRAADALLTAWWTDANAIPVGEEGRAGPEETFAWQLRAVHNADVERIGGQAVRLTLRNAVTSPANPSDGPLATVDLVLPAPQPTNKDDDPHAQRRADREATP